MPLLAQDEFGRVYQTEGLSEFDDLGVGYYAEMGDEDSVYFGDMSKKALANKKALYDRKRKERAYLINKQRIENARRRQLLLKKQKEDLITNQAISRIQAKQRARKSAAKLKQIKASKNPFAAYSQSTVGNPLSGWEDGSYITRPEHWKKHDFSGVGYSNDYGIGFFHEVSHPLMGHSYRNLGSNFEDGMGFKFRMPKIRIKAPKIKIKIPKQLKVPKKVQKAVRKSVKDVSKVAGKIYQAPIKLSQQILTKTPLVKDVYKGVDKLTGGTVSSLYKTALLPGDALRGKPITKAQFIESLANVVKVGAIVVTGGAAASVVGASAGALKQGPLGQTSWGRKLLSVGEIAGLATAGGMGFQKAIEKKVTDIAAAEASSAAGKKAGVAGAIIASAAVSATAGGMGAGETVKPSGSLANSAANASKQAGVVAAKKVAEEASKGILKFDSQAALVKFQDEVKKQAERAVAKEFQKKTGIPLDVATNVANGNIPTTEELTEKIKAEFYGTPEQLKIRLNQTLAQVPTSEPQFRAILEKKQLILANELSKREKLVEQVKNFNGEELAKANRELLAKVNPAKKMQDELKKLSDQHDKLIAKGKSNTANLAEKKKLALQVAELNKKIKALKPKYDAQVKEVEEAKKKADFTKEVGGFRVLQAEYGGQGAREKYLNEDESVFMAHPMLAYNLIPRKVGA